MCKYLARYPHFRMNSWLQAAMKNDLEYLQKNVQHYCKCRDKQGRTALMYAATVGAKESAQFLAKYEAGLCDHVGYSALMFSLICRHDDITEMLAEKEG